MQVVLRSVLLPLLSLALLLLPPPPPPPLPPPPWVTNVRSKRYVGSFR